jgi:hypothetical protein
MLKWLWFGATLLALVCVAFAAHLMDGNKKDRSGLCMYLALYVIVAAALAANSIH